MLVDDGRVALDDPVERWLPELASRVVVRTPASPVDDVVPAVRPITVLDLLTSRAGYGWPSDFSLPAVELLFDVQTDGREVQLRPVRTSGSRGSRASRCSTSRARRGCTTPARTSRASSSRGRAGSRCPSSSPSGCSSRSAWPTPASRCRRRSATASRAPTGPRRRRARAGRRTRRGVQPPPAFPAGSGGLVSTADDWHRFARLLLGGGTLDGRRLLSPESVRQMTTNHLTAAQRAVGDLFLEGQGWGFGGSVDDAAIDPWNVPGRYGWVGGTGTTAHIVPSTGARRDPAHAGRHDQPGRARDHARLLAARGRLRRPPPRRCARRARRSGRCASPPRGSRRARRGGSRRAV